MTAPAAVRASAARSEPKTRWLPAMNAGNTGVYFVT